MKKKLLGTILTLLCTCLLYTSMAYSCQLCVQNLNLLSFLVHIVKGDIVNTCLLYTSGAIYVLTSNGTANAGYAAVPLLFDIVCIGGYKAYKNKE